MGDLVVVVLGVGTVALLVSYVGLCGRIVQTAEEGSDETPLDSPVASGK